MRRHTKGGVIVSLAVFLEFLRMVALMAVKDKEAIATHSPGTSVLLEMTNPIHAFLLCCPTVVGNSDHLVAWETAILVPRREVIFARNNDI